MGEAARRGWDFISSARIAAPLLFALWLFLGWKVIKGGYIQDSWVKARDYMRSVNLAC